jgi:8-oxo-dGTP diphosphatase
VIEVVCGVILDAEGRVLACRRSMGRHLGGLWEFPGGKVDAGEMHEEALQRELEEELGVVVAVGDRLDAVVEWSDGEVSIRLTPFLCHIREGAPAALEHEEIRWCESHELAGLEWAEADIPIVAEIQSGNLGEWVTG